MADDKNTIDLKESHGWLYARLACSDPTEDGMVTAAGLAVRMDLDEIYMYSAEEPGVIEIHVRSAPATGDWSGSVCVIGKLETMDKIMKRHHGGIREVR